MARSPNVSPDLQGQTAEELIHELQVHQIELEMQAQELRRAHGALEESRDNYLDLYEFAPLGYLTLTEKALVEKANLTSAALLGIDRGKLVGARFSKFLAEEEADKWHLYFRNVLRHEERQTCIITLARGDGSSFPARLESIRVSDSSEIRPTVRVAIVDVTDIEEAKELRASEARFDRLAEGSGTITWEVDKGGLFTHVSHVSEAVLGYRPDELVGKKHFYDLVMAAERETIRSKALEMFQQRKRFVGLERAIKAKDGSIRWNSITGIPLLNADGTLHSYQGSNTDITERKRAQEMVFDAKNKLKATLDSLPDMVLEIDEEERFIAYHEAKEATSYMRRDELLDRKLNEVLPPEAVQVIRTAIGEARNTGLGHGSFSITKPQGTSYFEMLMSCKGGASPTFIASVRDVNKRMQLEQQLSESEVRYRTLVERLLDGVLIHRRGRIVFVNPAAKGLLHIPPGLEVEKLMLMDFFHPEDRSLVLHRMREAQKSELPPTYERMLDFQGHELCLEISAVPFADRDGGAALVILHDVSERKRAEESLREANKKLNLLSRITRHDINNQMVALEECLSRLEKEESDLADVSPLLKARAAAKRISALITFTGEYHDIGIAAASWQTVRASIKMALLLVPLGGVKAQNEVPADLEIFADPLILKVFEILVDGALKNDDTITTIRFSFDERHGARSLVCQDDGVGIPEAMKEGLFEKDFDEGRGLGLFLCREILAITGITIAEVGRPGHGARFIMTVPPNGLRRAKTERVEGQPH
ncbi:MAG: PAS domain S-box protein [Methanomassiliicoccales archaeon]